MAVAKYIVYRRNGMEAFVLFDTTTQHKDIASALGVQPDAAGFILVSDSLRCYGESTSLNVKSRDVKDAGVIQRLLTPE